MVPSCRSSAWAGGSAECCWAHSGSWWHQSSVVNILPSILAAFRRDRGARAREQGQGSPSLQEALPRTHRNCWWCQPFAVAAFHPEAELEPSSRKAPELVYGTRGINSWQWILCGIPLLGACAAFTTSRAGHTFPA